MARLNCRMCGDAYERGSRGANLFEPRRTDTGGIRRPSTSMSSAEPSSPPDTALAWGAGYL